MSFLVDELVNGLMAYGLALMVNCQSSCDLFRTPLQMKSGLDVPLNFLILQPVSLMRQALSQNRSFMSLVAQVASFTHRRSVAVEFSGNGRVMPAQLMGNAPETLTLRFQDADLVSLLYCQMRIICFYHST